MHILAKAYGGTKQRRDELHATNTPTSTFGLFGDRTRPRTPEQAGTQRAD
jgi:hypothetical protein